MKLVLPNLKYLRSWNQAIKEYQAKNSFGSWYTPNTYTNLKDYIADVREKSKRTKVIDGKVPNSTFWLIDKNQYIGSVNIRHTLTPQLKIIGGNIGYAIRPSRWNKGYGSELLRLALKKAKLLKLTKVLITCDDSNIASRKIIEKNGGLLKEKATLDGKLIRRYWIKL